MLISVGSWQFDVNIAYNLEISAAQAAEHCTCGYCRNYYEAIDTVCPSLRAFMAEFGINIEGPDELSPFEPTIYEVSFIVNGTIVHKSDDRLYVDGVPIKILDSSEADMDTERPEPYFVLVVGLIELPWLLDEDSSQVISPANEEQYLQRMQMKLLRRIDDESFYS